jgi:carbonic anhydrase/acetyltransferase-like protein (isoleucine patch superfamily)
MGRPATVKRELTAEEVAEIRWYADNYVGYRLDYMADGGAR